MGLFQHIRGKFKPQQGSKKDDSTLEESKGSSAKKNPVVVMPDGEAVLGYTRTIERISSKMVDQVPDAVKHRELTKEAKQRLFVKELFNLSRQLVPEGEDASKMVDVSIVETEVGTTTTTPQTMSVKDYLIALAEFELTSKMDCSCMTKDDRKPGDEVVIPKLALRHTQPALENTKAKAVSKPVGDDSLDMAFAELEKNEAFKGAVVLKQVMSKDDSSISTRQSHGLDPY